MLFNMELLCFMKLEDSRNYYKLILDKIPKSNKFDEFIEYFEKSWFPKSESDTTKYDFSLWSYYDKFDFRETKNN